MFINSVYIQINSNYREYPLIYIFHETRPNTKEEKKKYVNEFCLQFPSRTPINILPHKVRPSLRQKVKLNAKLNLFKFFRRKIYRFFSIEMPIFSVIQQTF